MRKRSCSSFPPISQSAISRSGRSATVTQASSPSRTGSTSPQGSSAASGSASPKASRSSARASDVSRTLAKVTGSSVSRCAPLSPNLKPAAESQAPIVPRSSTEKPKRSATGGSESQAQKSSRLNRPATSSTSAESACAAAFSAPVSAPVMRNSIRAPSGRLPKTFSIKGLAAVMSGVTTSTSSGRSEGSASNFA